MFVNTMRGLLLLATCTFLVGCSDLQPVTGKVKFKDGTTPETGEITFAWMGAGEGGRTAVGTIESDGTFELMTYNPGDGAHIGKHQVYITSCTPECKDEYSDVDNPFKEVEVTSSTNHFEFEIEKAE